MARDYAKAKTRSGKKKTTGAGRARSRRTAASGNKGGGMRMYFAGLISGVFVSFLLYLATLPPSEVPNATADADSAGGAADTTPQPPKPRFDFYTMLPEQTIEIEVPAEEVEPARDLGGTPRSTERYVLQAGSFRQREDADRRRAELLLLGLEPSIQESNSDNGRWFRVYLGPFESRSEMSRARGLTAGQDIDTLLLKRGAP